MVQLPFMYYCMFMYCTVTTGYDYDDYYRHNAQYYDQRYYDYYSNYYNQGYYDEMGYYHDPNSSRYVAFVSLKFCLFASVKCNC